MIMSAPNPATEGTINISVRPKAGPRPAPEAANFFQIAHSGMDVQMAIGYMDLHEFHELIQKQRTAAITKPKGVARATIDAEITHRISMSLQTFVMLKQQIDSIAAQLSKSGFQLPAAGLLPDLPE